MSFVVIVLLSLPILSTAQDTSSQLTKLTDDIAHVVQDKTSGWQHNSVKPLEGGKDVIVDQWISGDKIVKIAILRHQSRDEAMRTLHKFASNTKATSKPQNVGEEGYAWGVGNSIAFRKGGFTIYVSAVAANITEEESLSKEFAQYVDVAIKK